MNHPQILWKILNDSGFREVCGMNTSFITLAARAKGPLTLLKRVCRIISRYGLTPAKLDRSLHLYAQTLKQFDCGASLAVPAVVLERNSHIITKYLDQNIEFVVHGYAHLDYSQLTPEGQLSHLRRARQVFDSAGIEAVGFRAPYLHCKPYLHKVIEAAGFSYTSSESVLWNLGDTDAFSPLACASYRRAIEFYDPWLASERPSLPWLRNKVVEIPVSLPDDEMLLDRLGDGTSDLVERAWRRILSETYRRGELFTIQLHPERIAWCVGGLSAVLSEARALTPLVWLARLGEIATWWAARAATTVAVRQAGDGAWHLSADGPPGVTILARGVDVLVPTRPWADGYRQVTATTCVVRGARRPFVGVSSACSPELISILRQQGYIVQVSDDSQAYSVYLDRTDLAPQDERSFLAQLEGNVGPLVRLGRWPNGARSALCITGDIDGLTIWDYGVRLFGK
jgi:peptidoglycan/xylan/chitin deacetylase (PgdA/CDA1 family)